MARKPKKTPVEPPQPVVVAEPVVVKEEPLGFLQSYKKITVFQVIALLAITLPWLTGAWKSTAWIIKPALAGAIADILKEDGIDLKAQNQQIQDTAKSAEETKAAVDRLLQQQQLILQQINKAVQQTAAPPPQ